MKKFLIIGLILCLSTSCLEVQAFGKKKTKEKKPVITQQDIGNLEGGYVGTLPDVTERFQKFRQKEALPLFQAIDGFNTANEIKPVPRDNPAFVNIILKKDRTSQYINDINYLIPMVERLAKSIEDGEDIQKFSARAYILKENAEYLRQKYENKAESSYISYQKLIQLCNYAQTVATLRVEKGIYSPYLAYGDSGYIFNQANIDEQLNYLLQEIEQTVIVLKEAN